MLRDGGAFSSLGPYGHLLFIDTLHFHIPHHVFQSVNTSHGQFIKGIAKEMK
jgi:hypothetical protein